MALAVDGRKLVAIPILQNASVDGSASRKRSRDGLLVHSLGRGVSISQLAPSKQATEKSPRRLGPITSSIGDDPAWEAQKSQLDNLSSRKDSDAFDKAMIAALQVTDQGNSLFDQHKASYLLGQVFSVHSTGSERDQAQQSQVKMKVEFWPSEVANGLLKGTS